MNGNGRNARGQFTKGNQIAKGNPHARHVAAFREAILNAVSPRDISVVIKVLVKAAKAGKPWAIREILDRVVGRPQAAVDVSVAQPMSREAIEERITRLLGIEFGPIEGPE